ncbi:MAG: DUF4872 domain-containing protein [Deltaproteobacteria bacterium]|nr:DUF4872 domain-containing protein [Deltaproteobacteria bacterium]
MKTLVSGFVHTPGLHCGSTAMADLLNFKGIAVSEPMAFGLGSGADFYYFDTPGMKPSAWLSGRSGSFEDDLCATLGLAYREFFDKSSDAAWERARARIDAGEPLSVQADVRYLDYYATDTHFNGHRLILAGYDDDGVYVADTHFEGLQRLPKESFAKARGSRVPPSFGGPNAWWEVETPAAPLAITREHVARAVHHAAARFFEGPTGFNGEPGFSLFIAGLPNWTALPDAAWCARFAYQCIEKRGTGGGCFRTLYARFLDEAAMNFNDRDFQRLAALAHEASAKWTLLARAFKSASEETSPDFAALVPHARAMFDAERKLADLSLTTR